VRFFLLTLGARTNARDRAGAVRRTTLGNLQISQSLDSDGTMLACVFGIAAWQRRNLPVARRKQIIGVN
jgi:hypothetical protein